MKFFLISQDGDGLGIAFRLKEEGHDVTVQIRNKKAAKDYDGLLKKSDKILTAPDTIFVFDSSGGGKTAERLRGQGFPVVGASMFADQLELDRSMGLGLMEEAGIKVPPYKHFTDWDQAIAYAEQRGERMCIKSDNDLPSYVASCVEDMIEFMKFHQKEGTPADFDLQDFVKGMEISTEGWFDGNNFSQPFNHTFERKQLMNEDLGPSGGCAGNVTWACQHIYCKVVEEGLKKFEPILRHHHFTGMIDLNSIVNDDGVWGLEWTPRFGYDAFPALMEMLTEGVGDVLAAYAKGQPMPKFPMKDKGFGAGVRVTIPPYPSDFPAPEGMAIRGLVRADRPHAYFYNVFLDKEATLRSSGAWGTIAVFTGFGEEIGSALQNPMAIAERVEISNKQYRTDLAYKFHELMSQYQGFNQPESSPERDAVQSSTLR